MNKPQKKSLFGALPIKVDANAQLSAQSADPEQDLQVFPVPPQEFPVQPARTPHGPELVKGTSPNDRRMKANAKDTKKTKMDTTIVAPSLRLTGDWVEPELVWKRRLYEVLAVVFTGWFLFVLISFWAPAPGRPGIDENGYLVGIYQMDGEELQNPASFR